MASFNNVQDIHICGLCRMEFSDILDFLKHKKDSCYAGQETSLPQPVQLEVQEPSEATKEPQAPVVNSSLNHNQWTNGSLSNTSVQTVIGNQRDSLLFSTTAQPELHEKLILTNFPLNSKEEDTASSSIDHSSDGLKHYVHPSPSASHKLFEKSITKSLPHNLPLKNNLSFHSSQSILNQDSHADKISTDGVAVYIVSPKSFASSMKKTRDFENPPCNPISKLFEPSLHGNSHKIVLGSNDELLGLKRTVHSSSGKDIQHQVANQSLSPKNSACFYTEGSVPSGSDTSTPCPEDLEVGQISASVLGQQHPQVPQGLGRSFVTEKSGSSSKAGNSPSNSGNLPASCESGAACTSSNMEPAVVRCKTLVSYIRQNTASAPTIVGCSRQRIKSRVNAEKRERLQGLSDDVLASLHNAEIPFQTGSDSHQLEKALCEPHISSSKINLPRLKSYRAVFTSPSRSGHRLSPNKDPHLTSPELNEIPQQVAESSAHSQSSDYSSSNGNAMEYKDISAAVKLQRPFHRSELEKKALFSNDPLRSCIKRGAERQIIFDNNGCSDKTLTSGTQHPSILYSVRNIHNGSRSIDLPKVEAVNVISEVKEGNVPVTSPSNTATSLPTQYYVSTNNPARNPDTMICTKTSITSVTAALRQQIPTVFCSSDSTESTQAYQRSPSKINLDISSKYHEEPKALSNADTVIVFKDGDANFVIVPESVQQNRLPSLQANHGGFAQCHHILSQEDMPSTSTSQPVEHVVLQRSNGGQGFPHESTQTNIESTQEKRCWPISNNASSLTHGNQDPSTTSDTVYSLQNQTQLEDSAQSAIYTQASQNSNSASHTLPAAVYNAISSVAPSQMSITSAREPCIIRPKSNPQSQNISTLKFATHSQPQPEAKVSTVYGVGNKKERRFTCKFDKCRYSSSLYKDFRRHYRTHTGERPYHCQQCGKTFSRSDKLRIHQRGHDGTKPFQCTLCDYKTLDSGNLKKHLRIHSDERPYKCQICPYASRNSSHLIVHLRSHTGDAPFVCSVCGAQFRIGTDLKRHLRTHTGEKPFQCELCDYKSAHKGNLTSHMRINHSKADEVSCDHCDFSSSSRKLLKDHAKMHDPNRIFKCQQCPQTFSTARALRAHLCIHDTVKPYQCSYCPFACKRSGNLKKHVQRQHMDKLQKTPGKNKGKRRRIKGAGAQCGENSKTKVKTGSERPTSYPKQHKCSQCGRGFVRLDSLQSHMNQHKREGNEQRARLDRRQINPLPSSQLEQYPVESTGTTISTRKPLPPTLRRQGMKHIAAAASKLFEESYASTKPSSSTYSSNSDERISRSKEEQKNNVATVQAKIEHYTSSSSKDGNSEVNNMDKPHTQPAPVQHSHQLPWEHSSYTLSLQPEDHINKPAPPSNPAVVSLSHAGTNSDVHSRPSAVVETVLHSNIDLQKSNQKMKCAFSKQLSLASKQKIHETTDIFYQPTRSSSGVVMKQSHDSLCQQKLQQQQNFVQGSHPQRMNIQSSQNVTNMELDVTEQPFVFSQQAEELNSQETTSFNFQLIPQVLAPTQELVHQILLPPAQVHPSTHIQIVLPGAHGQVSSHAVSLPATQQQVLLQDHGPNHMEVMSIPYNQFPIASTSGHNAKVLQTVTSSGAIAFEPKQGRQPLQALGHVGEAGAATCGAVCGETAPSMCMIDQVFSMAAGNSGKSQVVVMELQSQSEDKIEKELVLVQSSTANS